MPCGSCQSENRSGFHSEISIHPPGLNNLTKPPVLAFPNLLVCLECGHTEFLLEKTELRELAEGNDALAAL